MSILADGYVHHVFISYDRGHPKWEYWMRDCFLSLLDMHLSDAKRRPQICIDKDVGAGENFVRWLGDNISRSALMIAVWSEAYFESPWCQHELDMMLARGDAGLIIPIVVQDCERLPGLLGEIETESFYEFRYPWIEKTTPTYHAMAVAVRRLVERIRDVKIPEFDPNWVAECNSRFAAVYAADRAGKRLLPDHYELPQPQIIDVIPRLPMRRRNS